MRYAHIHIILGMSITNLISLLALVSIAETVGIQISFALDVISIKNNLDGIERIMFFVLSFYSFPREHIVFSNRLKDSV